MHLFEILPTNNSILFYFTTLTTGDKSQYENYLAIFYFYYNVNLKINRRRISFHMKLVQVMDQAVRASYRIFFSWGETFAIGNASKQCSTPYFPKVVASSLI